MRRSATAAASVLAVFAALVVVALASRGDPSDRTAAAYEAAATSRSLLLGVLGAVFLASAVLAVWALWPDGSGTPKPAPPFRWLPYALIAGLVVVLAYVAPERPPERNGAEDAPGAFASGGDEDDGGEDDGGEDAFTRRASPTASLAIAVLGLAALLAFSVTLRARQRRAAAGAADDGAGENAGGTARHGARPPTLDDDLLAALRAGDLDGALAAIRAEPDPRRAVLLAYAVLEARLATTRAARPLTATPQEWLRAIRRALAADAPAVGDAAGRLTTLYERGRFRDAPMDEADRGIALAAVATLRDLHDRPAPTAEAAR